MGRQKMIYWLVGLAGALGALLRYETGVVGSYIWGADYPLFTFLMNMAGSFGLGLLTAWTARHPSLPGWLQPVIGTGMIGAFTTFSTFSVETIALLREGSFGTAALYVVLSIWGGLAMAWLGYRSGSGERRNRRPAGGTRGNLS